MQKVSREKVRFCSLLANGICVAGDLAALACRHEVTELESVIELFCKPSDETFFLAPLLAVTASVDN